MADFSRVNLGHDLLPWQAEFLDVALEYDPETDRPVHNIASILSVPRQSGKSFMVKLLITWWATKWPRQRILFVAQTRLDAREHLMGLGDDLLLAGFPVRVYRGVPERLLFPNGSQVSVAAPTHSSVHGQSLDLAVMDEAWLSLSPDILQGVVPSRAARPNSMMFCITTMGTESSETWNGFRDRGREGEPGICYYEYSMDPEVHDLYDEDQWPEWMPALGLTIQPESIRAGVALLSPAEARRAYGNVTTSTEWDLFDMAVWKELLDPYELPPVGNVVLCADANPHVPGGAAISAAWQRDDDERWHVSIVDYVPGASVLWIPDRLEALVTKFKPTAIVMGNSVATRAVMPEVEQLASDFSIPFRKLTAGDVQSAGVLWSDYIREGNMTHDQSEALDMAMEFAIPKQGEDGWRLDRKAMKVDGSPLSASIHALFVAVEEKAHRPSVGVF